MGVSHSGIELGQKFERLATDLRDSQSALLSKAAMASKIAFLAAPGAPHGKLQGVGTKGARVGVKYRVFGTTAVVRWFGPAHLVNNPTKAHDITPKKRGRRSGKKAVVVNGQPVARSHTKGTRGKHFFEIGKKVAVKEATKVVQSGNLNTIRNVFK